MRMRQFIGYADNPPDAIDDAETRLDAWWNEQQIRYTDNGGSFFQVSASLSHANYRDGKIEFIYCISVFDPRDNE